MKIMVDDKLVLELTDIQKKVIKTFIFDEEFESDMIRRVKNSLEEKYQNCFKRLKDEWDPKLEEIGISMIPTNKDEYSRLVFSQPGYKSRSQRDNI